jgi:shikimate kinase
MKTQKHIILIGFMGTGKTSVGKQLNQLLSLPWVDTDRYLEEKWGFSIADYFTKFGEPAFRKEESEGLQQLLNRSSPTIITTGGGIVLKEENREQMLKKAWIICLTADLKEIIYHVIQDSTTRPLLKGDIYKEISQLWQERDGKYSFADITIDTTHRSVEAVAREIVVLWNERGDRP